MPAAPPGSANAIWNPSPALSIIGNVFQSDPETVNMLVTGPVLIARTYY